MTPDQAACPHEKFTARVEVTRLADREGGPVAGYAADITVGCIDCGLPFAWAGVPGGVSPGQPACSADLLELRAPIEPAVWLAGKRRVRLRADQVLAQHLPGLHAIPVPEMLDLLETAWTVIANAGWDGAARTDGWQDAAVRWRDRWHAMLNRAHSTVTDGEAD